MAQSASPNEIAELEWQKVTSLAWPTLSVIYGLQALFAQNPIDSWQIFYIAGLIASLVLSFSLGKTKLTKFSSTPIVLYLLLAPIVIGDSSKNSWMSIGLVTFAAVIYYSTISNIFWAVSIVGAISIFQSVIVQFGYPSISDNLDINYFHSYFSFLWIFIMGISSIFIRRRYLRTAENIQEYVDSEMNLALSRMESLKQINEKDSRNLRLHGTVLNSLIYIRNLINDAKNFTETFSAIREEIEALSLEKKELDTRDFSVKLRDLIESRTIKKINISQTSFEGKFESQQFEDSILEIVRELILNTEKHTDAKNAILVISKKSNKGIRIEFKDDSLKNIEEVDRKVNLSAPFQSKNLNRLITSSSATMRISRLRRNQWRRIEIEVPFIDIQKELEATLVHSRLDGLNDFALNFVRASSIVALLSLPGYWLVNLSHVTMALTICTTVLFYVVLQVRRNLLTISFISLTSSLIIPSLSYNISSCSQLASIPWLFNHILTVGFLALISIKNRFLKWIPVSILTFESLYFPTHYPANCKNIFLGSLPGIPLIIIFSMAVLGVRRREINFDQGEAFEISQIDTATDKSNQYREQSYSDLIKDCQVFLRHMERDTDPQRIFKLISLQIEKIQTFLLCAEHFESQIIRSCFEIFSDSQMRGISGKITIFGTNFHLAEKSIDIEGFISDIVQIKGDSTSNLTLMNLESLELHFEGLTTDYRPDQIQGIPVFYNP